MQLNSPASPAGGNLLSIRDKIRSSEPAGESAAAGNMTGEPPALSADFRKTLDQALQRRFRDYLYSLTDLRERLARAAALAESRAETVNRQAEELARARQLFESIRVRLGSGEPDTPASQGELAELCRTLEHDRLTAAAAIARIENQGPETVLAATQSAAKPTVRGLFSAAENLSFLAILKISAAISLPLAVAILGAAVLLMVAIIGSFSGALRW